MNLKWEKNTTAGVISQITTGVLIKTTNVRGQVCLKKHFFCKLID